MSRRGKGHPVGMALAQWPVTGLLKMLPEGSCTLSDERTIRGCGFFRGRALVLTQISRIRVLQLIEQSGCQTRNAQTKDLCGTAGFISLKSGETYGAVYIIRDNGWVGWALQNDV